MSPEQTRDSSQVDHRTDLWSLGVVLYEMVAGRAPFEGNDVVDGRVIAIREGEPPPLATHAAEIPEHLEEIARKALARDVNQRYQTAKELLVDLRNLARSLEEGEHTARAAAPGSTFVTTISGKRGVLVALMLSRCGRCRGLRGLPMGGSRPILEQRVDFGHAEDRAASRVFRARRWSRRFRRTARR